MEIKEILNQIGKIFPDAKTELKYETPFQFLVAVILSAQSTDVQVNKVTAKFFDRIKTPQDVVDIGEDGFRELIRSINFFNNKAKNIYKLSLAIVADNNKIPETLEELTALPGVGLKTAKLYLSQICGQDYIPVDTHIFRVVNRIGILSTKNPEETSHQLENIIPKDYKHTAHHLLIFFGRYHCKAIKPKCDECPFNSSCKFYNLNKKNA